MARIKAEIEGQTYTADSAMGRGCCKDCEMPRRGKTCPWSMVCSNILEGAIFRREKQPREADSRAEYYEKNKYTGD